MSFKNSTHIVLYSVFIWRDKSFLFLAFIQTYLLVGKHDPLGDEGGVLHLEGVALFPGDVRVPQVKLLPLLRGAARRHGRRLSGTDVGMVTRYHSIVISDEPKLEIMFDLSRELWGRLSMKTEMVRKTNHYLKNSHYLSKFIVIVIFVTVTSQMNDITFSLLYKV